MERFASRTFASPQRGAWHRRGFGARAVIAVALVVGFSSPSLAFVVTAEQRAACAPDVYRLCSADIPIVSKIIACVRREKDNLSPACRAVVEAAEQQLASRSFMTPESVWCQFPGEPKTPGETDWLKWCGSAAQH